MELNKLYLTAIKALPDNWVHEDTRVTTYKNFAIAVNPEFAPIKFIDGKWGELVFEPINPELLQNL